jgi:hypothetical protein
MRKLVAALIIGAVGLAGANAIAKEERNEAGESKAEMALKERKAAPTDAQSDANATLAALLDKRDDKAAFSTAKGARVSGTLVQVETEEDGDLHLVLAPSGAETDTKRWVIAEIPQEWQKRDKSMTLESVEKLRGKPVTVTGWIYYEPEAPSPDPRGTLWEIHPVTSIK